MENSAHRIFEIKSKDDPEGNLRRTAIAGGMEAANSKGNTENSQLQPAAQHRPSLQAVITETPINYSRADILSRSEFK
jgi:hypothetical protein